MSIRGNRFFQIWVDLNSRLFALLFGTKKAKKFYEWAYWRLKIMKEKEFSNDHYQYFFTEFWGLETKDYKGTKLLDIGCGPRGSLEWATMTDRRVGLDTLSDKYQKMNGDKHQMEYVTAGAEAIPFEDNYFDVISSINSLDHVENLEKCISEIKRVLKPGGRFLLIVELHPFITFTEPYCLEWGFSKEFEPEFRIDQEWQYEGDVFFKSLRERIPFDHSNPKKRYGLLAASYTKL